MELLLLYLLFQSAVLQNLPISFFLIHHVECKVLEYESFSSLLILPHYVLKLLSTFYYKVKTVKFSHYRPGVAQRAGRGIALLIHDCGSRRG